MLSRTLKSETAKLHRLVEDRLRQRGAIGSEGGYRVYLGAMLKLHAAHAAALDRSSVLAQLTPHAAELTQALREDLASIGESHPKSVAPAPQPRGDAACLGIGYVFEGSALGASHILKTLGPDAERPRSYLRRLASGSAARWPRYKEFLDAHAGDARPVVAAAAGVFGGLAEDLKAC